MKMNEYDVLKELQDTMIKRQRMKEILEKLEIAFNYAESNIGYSDILKIFRRKTKTKLEELLKR